MQDRFHIEMLMAYAKFATKYSNIGGKIGRPTAVTI